MTYNVQHRLLHFKQPAGTSRGVYTTRDVWYITLTQGALSGTGECAPLPDLSCDAMPHDQFLQLIHHFAAQVASTGVIPHDELRHYPSILFALECALGKLTQTQTQPAGFAPISINGLIWMGTFPQMKERLQEKLDAGYRCIKLKIGAINFQDELSLIRQIRSQFTRQQVELRVDANGAFSPHEAPERLHHLAQYDLHSIEQPIRQGQWEEMARLCEETPLPIGLDEELIGVNDPTRKALLLDTIRPQYLILKPSLHGGLSGCDEWIRMARERNIGWWATSALESNIGLADIARWVSQYHPTMPQGLGTGLLFTDNTPAQTQIRGDQLYML